MAAGPPRDVKGAVMVLDAMMCGQAIRRSRRSSSVDASFALCQALATGYGSRCRIILSIATDVVNAPPACGSSFSSRQASP